MSSDDSISAKRQSLVDTLMNAINPHHTSQRLSPISEAEIERYLPFYGLVGSALWDLFLTGHVGDECKPSSFDNYFVRMSDCYFIAICSGTFKEVTDEQDGSEILTVCQEDWSERNHKRVRDFFESLEAIIDEKSLAGIILTDAEDMFTMKVNNPYCLMKLLKTYLETHDVFTLDNVRPQDLKTKPKNLTADDIKGLAETLRDAAQHSWDTTHYTVASVDERIDIRHYPPVEAPTIDNADIILIEAEMVEETAPFSLKLIENTYADCVGRTPEPNSGLTLLH